MDKKRIRNLIVKLVMGGWTPELESKYAPAFKTYVLTLHPEAKVEVRGTGFSLTGIDKLKCHHSTEKGVWALAAKELAR